MIREPTIHWRFIACDSLLAVHECRSCDRSAIREEAFLAQRSERERSSHMTGERMGNELSTTDYLNVVRKGRPLHHYTMLDGRFANHLTKYPLMRCLMKITSGGLFLTCSALISTPFVLNAKTNLAPGLTTILVLAIHKVRHFVTECEARFVG